jgi:hypothetical protein
MGMGDEIRGARKCYRNYAHTGLLSHVGLKFRLKFSGVFVGIRIYLIEVRWWATVNFSCKKFYFSIEKK